MRSERLLVFSSLAPMSVQGGTLSRSDERAVRLDGGVIPTETNGTGSAHDGRHRGEVEFFDKVGRRPYHGRSSRQGEQL
jgi:hypothetical protein